MDFHKHTKPPWRCRRNGKGSYTITDRRGRAILQITAPIKRSDEEKHANAMLAAAAPKMLDALYTALNLEKAAIEGGRMAGALKGLDVGGHFRKIRDAVFLAESKMIT